MNVLILTPDAVGSTLLQRLITIYLTFHELDRPVINLHELTNGLEKYYSAEFGREIVSKRRVANWGYYQSLEEIVEILASVDHYKTSRLAHYHLRNRQDSVAEQIPFYRYLDDNFYIIACRRSNVFEHAISMCMNKVTKKLNVYTHREKVTAFADVYRNKIVVDVESLRNQLEAYKAYIAWSTDYFNPGSFFNYEQHVPAIEKFILDLPIFSQCNRMITWQDKFDISFNDWNRCHRLPSDIGYLAMTNPSLLEHVLTKGETHDIQALTVEYQRDAMPEWPAINSTEDYNNLPQDIKLKWFEMRDYHAQKYLPQEMREYWNRHQHSYEQANSAIKRMQELDIIVSPPPIKKQNLAEKMFTVKNWSQCLEVYNDWIEQNPQMGSHIKAEDLQSQMEQEREFWHPPVNLQMQAYQAKSVGLSLNQNDDHL